MLTGIPDIANGIDVSKPSHDPLADDAGLDFAFELTIEFFFDLFDDGAFGGIGDGTLATGIDDAAEHLVAVKGHARAVAFDDHQPGVLLDTLVGGEPLAARQTFPAAADDSAPFTGAGVDHLVVVFFTKWTDHCLTRI